MHIVITIQYEARAVNKLLLVLHATQVSVGAECRSATVAPLVSYHGTDIVRGDQMDAENSSKMFGSRKMKGSYSPA